MHLTIAMGRPLFFNAVRPKASQNCESVMGGPTYRPLIEKVTGMYMTYVARPSHVQHFPDFRRNPYFCPALIGFDLLERLAGAKIPAYISAGGAEDLLDEIKALRDGMKQSGMDVTYREVSHHFTSELTCADTSWVT